MRIIITGGSGFIGRALTENLTQDKHEVVILSRNPAWVVGLPEGAQAITWDGKSSQGWGHLADGADVIINLAGENISGEIPFGVRWTSQRKKRLVQSRMNAGKAVVEAITAARKKPSLVIQSSGVNYYGTSNEHEFDESSSSGNDFLADVCRKWEACTADVDKMGIRRVVMRTGLVFSSHGGILPLQSLPFKFFVGGPIGNGKQPLSWIHLQDALSAIRWLIDQEEATGVYNLSSPNPVTNADFGHALGRALGRPSFIPTPGIIFKIAFGEASTLLLDGVRALPKKLLAQGFEFQYPDIDTALKDIHKQG